MGSDAGRLGDALGAGSEQTAATSWNIRSCSAPAAFRAAAYDADAAAAGPCSSPHPAVVAAPSSTRSPTAADVLRFTETLQFAYGRRWEGRCPLIVGRGGRGT